MAYAQSVYNQSSVLKINVMVVDNDPVYLQDISRMIEKSKYRDPSTMDITVIAVKDSGEALSTLKIERNNIDLIVTDYYMPGMNGLQLKRQIEQEYGNVPVIVMSSDTNKEQESLTCGAMCFIPKPIKVTDLPIIYQLALNYKRNGKSILWNENNHKDTYVSVPQQIQLLPEQANVLKTKKKNCSSRSMTSTNGSCARTDSSRKDRKRTSNGSSGDDVESLSQPTKKKSKLKWTDHLQDLFLQAIRHHTLEKAVPKKILEHMNVPYLTRENVASHLQKYRQFLRKVAEQGLLSLLSIQDIDSIFPHAPIREPHYNYCTPSSTSWYETSLSNRSFYSKPGQGRLGQSRLLSNTREPVRFNQIPHNYMNRSSTNGPHRIGSNLTLPIKTNLNFSNQPSQNVGRTFFEPTLMANKTVQSSQVLGFGQHGMSAINGNHFNINMMSRYGSLTPNQPGHSQFSYGVQSFLNNENSAYKPQSNADATTQPTLEVPQVENLNLYEDLGITNELPCDTSNFQFDHNKQEGEVASTTNFDLPAKFSTELNQNFSLEEDGDWNFVNINQGHSNVETPNTFAAPETNSSIPNMNPNHDQEQQDDPDFIDWSLLDPQDLLNEYDDFMDSLFTNDMN